MSQPWYFLCSSTYWGCGRNKRRSRRAVKGGSASTALLSATDPELGDDDDDDDVILEDDGAVLEEISPTLRQLLTGTGVLAVTPLHYHRAR